MGEPDKEASRKALAAAVTAALDAQRVVATVSAARVRLAGSLGGLLLVLLLALLVDSVEGRLLAWPMALHSMAAAGFVLLASRTVAARIAWLMAALDLVLLTLIQLQAQRMSEGPAAVSALGLGLMVLLVVLNGQALSSKPMWWTGCEAIALQGWLSWSTGGGVVFVLLSAGLILAAVAMSQLAQDATRRLVITVTREHLARLGERNRADELEVARDTIERMLLEARERTERLEALQRDRENLTHLLVHDLRTPLTAVIGNIDWIHESLTGAGGSPQLVEASGEALERAQRLSSMICDILDVAKLEEGKLSPKVQRVRASTVLAEVCEQAQRSVRGQTLTFEVEAADALEVEADQELVRRILENLVSNGLRFAARRIRLAARQANDGIELRVQNDGPSIEKDNRAGLFEKFSQAGTDNVGWGLGLYFCRLAAEVHGGRIDVDDDRDWNVSFVVRLPASAPELAA